MVGSRLHDAISDRQRRLSRPRRPDPVAQFSQLNFRYDEPGEAPVEADRGPRARQETGSIKMLDAGEMDHHLSIAFRQFE